MKNTIFNVHGMSCSACSAAVTRAVEKLPGIKNVNVNLLTNSMSVIFDENALKEKDIIDAVVSAGYQASVKDYEKAEDKVDKLNKKANLIKMRLILSCVFLLLLMVVSMGHMVGINIFSHEQIILKGITELILFIPVGILNFKYYYSGFKALFKLNPNMDSLIAIGSLASVLYSMILLISGGSSHYYFESAAMILTFITIGKYLESKSKAKTTDAVNKLLDLSPKRSIILVDGVETEIDSKDIKVNDIVVMKAGASFPADGTVIHGEGSADESALTGESLPVEKSIDDSVTGGTILKNGYLRFRAEKVGSDTALASIIKLVEDATVTKPKIAKVADRISRVFVPVVILISIITFTIWYALSRDFALSLNFAISVLVISCPCSLGLATPTAIMVGTGKAAELGILVKSSEVFEKGSKTKTVLFDKTGTITEGSPSVTEFFTNHQNPLKILRICADIERLSDHPLAQAIVSYSETESEYKVENFQNTIGKGVSAVIEGNSYKIGNLSFLDIKETPDFFTERVNSLKSEGQTILYVSANDILIGIFGLADKIKETSTEAIKLLKDHNIESVMLTGDNEATANAIKNKAGISVAHADLLPADKNRILKEYQDHGITVMVGDGINDSPALAAADIGIALGAGTDIAMDSADIILLRNDLRDVHMSLSICRKTMKNIKENLFWALIYNSIGIPLAAGVLFIPLGISLSPMLGTIAMSLSSICVVTNALRLRRIKRDYTIESNTKKIRKEIKMKTVYIEGMMCPHCEARVKTILGELDANVVVNHKAGTATISENADNDKIKTVIEAAGYKVTDIK